MKKFYCQLFKLCDKKSAAFYSLILAACFLLTATIGNAQAPVDAACKILNRVGGIASLNGAEIPAFDPASKRVFVVAGPVIEYYSISKSGALTAGGSLPTHSL